VYQAQNDRMLWAFAESGDWINSYAISPNDKILATTIYDGSLALWDLRTGFCLQAIPTDYEPLGAWYYKTSNSLCNWQYVDPYYGCLAVDTATGLVEFPLRYPWETTCAPRELFIPFEVPPQPLTGYSPSYLISRELVKTKIRVIVSVCIDKNGEVKGWEIEQIKPECEGLEKTIEEIVAGWRFKPAMHDGASIGVWFSLILGFEPSK